MCKAWINIISIRMSSLLKLHRIIYSVRNQTDIIRSLFAVTFSSSLMTDCKKIISATKGIETDVYTNHFLKAFNFNQLHNTLLEIVGRDNLSVIFYENLLIFKDKFYEEISDLLGLSSSETSKLLDGASRLHVMNNQINTSPTLSTKLQLIFHQIKKINLNKIFNINFMSKLITFFKKKIFPSTAMDKKKVLERRLILDDALIMFKKNDNLIKNYFLESNKEFFEKNRVSKKIEKFYL